MSKPVKVLLISYNFPPFTRAGSLRSLSWFKHFSGDIDLTVVTRKWEDNRSYNKANYYDEDPGEMEFTEHSPLRKVYRVPNKPNFFFRMKDSRFSKAIKLNKVFTFFELLVKYSNRTSYDRERGLYRQARSLCSKEKFDVVIASGEPFVLFKYCYLLKKEFGVPYILDYRDGWTTNYTRLHNMSSLQRKLVKGEKKKEKRFLDQAHALCSISQQLVGEISKQQQVKANQLVVNNGIDVEEYAKAKPFESHQETFLLTFIGTLYEVHNVPVLLKAYERFLATYPDIKTELRFIGVGVYLTANHKASLDEYTAKYPEHILTTDYVAFQQSIQWQKSSKLLVKFNAIKQQENHFGKKLYEYAASGNRVLCINSEHIDDEGHFFKNKPFQFVCNTTDEAYEVMETTYQRWSNNASILNDISEEELAPYSTKNAAEKLEAYLIEHFANERATQA